MSKKILIIDDSALMRRVISDIINQSSEYEVAAIAKDGLEGYQLITANPYLYSAIILDINMPKMNGLELLKKLQEDNIQQTVIVVSTVVKEGAKETILALEYGAFDFVTKPDNYLETKSEDFKTLIHNMLDIATNTKVSVERVERGNMLEEAGKGNVSGGEVRVSAVPGKGVFTVPNMTSESRKNSTKAAQPAHGHLRQPSEPAQPYAKTSHGHRRSEGHNTSANGSSASSAGGKAAVDTSPQAVLQQLQQMFPQQHVVTAPTVRRPDLNACRNVKKGRIKLVALACSTGGPKSLQQVIPYLPWNLDAGIVLVQHMPKGFTNSLAQRLDELSDVTVKEAQEGDMVQRGCVYIAPGGNHMKIVQKGGQFYIELNGEPPIDGLRPCANIMYESLCDCTYDELTCVVLTGMGADGTNGIKQLAGCHKNIHVIAQDEETSIVYGMPKAVAQAGLVDEIVPLHQIAEAITKNVGVL